MIYRILISALLLPLYTLNAMEAIQIPTDVISAARTSALHTSLITDFFNQQLGQLSKPSRDLKFIALQTAIHHLKHKEAVPNTCATLLRHLWLTQSQLEESYLEQTLTEQKARTAELRASLAAQQEMP